MKKTLRKLKIESTKNYELLQSRCSCGPCGCMCTCAITQLDSNGLSYNTAGGDAGSYNRTYTAHT